MNKHEDLKILGGKNQIQSLLPGFLWEVGQVMTHGNTKYSVDNWKGGAFHRMEYVGAAMRHLLKYWSGEKYDPETGLHHLAHMTCSLMFLWYFDEGDTLPSRMCRCEACIKVPKTFEDFGKAIKW